MDFVKKDMSMTTNNSNIPKGMKERIQRIAISDSLRPSRLSLWLIALLELYFLVTWFIFNHTLNWSEFRYFLCYLVLFTFSGVAFVLSYVFEKDKQNGYKKIMVLQTIAAILLLVWATLITIFDADHHTEFSYIIYATIVVILPAVVYVNLTLLNLMYIICDVILIIFTVIIRPDNLVSAILNFVVFGIVSLCASNLYNRTKIVSIRREIELQNYAETDHLTGLYNRHRLNEIGQSILEENRKNKTELTCVMMDVDNFKPINDEYGHLVGDTVLKNAAQIVRETAVQHGGLAFRYGGEEFLLLFSDFSGHHARRVVEEIQNCLKTGIPDFELPVTMSFGIYTARPTEKDKIEQYFAEADDLLYSSKKNGKDRYTAFEKPF